MPGTTETQANRMGYAAALELQGFGLVDADVAAWNTRALIRSNIATGGTSGSLKDVPADRARQLADIFDYVLENGVTTIGAIAALTTVVGLLAIFTTFDTTLTADYKFMLPEFIQPQPSGF